MSRLAKLQAAIDEIDPHGTMKGISHEKSMNESLGFGIAPHSFHVSIPYSTWPAEEITKWPKPTTSILEDAFKDVLHEGYDSIRKGTNNKLASDISGNFFIDITHLTAKLPGKGFFTEKHADGPYKNQSIADKIATVINDLNDCTDVRPIVRVLMGIWGNETKQVGANAWTQQLQQEFDDMFWSSSSTRITNPRAEIYVGFYGPEFKVSPGDDPVTKKGNETDMNPPAAAVAAWFKTLWGTWGRFAQGIPNASKLNEAIAKFNTEYIVKTVLKDGLPAISWNHGKIVAVNGTHMMTGGANYWGEYMIGARDIYDMQAKVKGGAAISAHKYCDYFWEYLGSDHNTDGRSHLRMSKLSSKNWVVHDTNNKDHKVSISVPMFYDKPSNSTANKNLAGPQTGTIPVLSIAKLGDWHGKMTKISFPVQIVDALRNLAINLAWETARVHTKSMNFVMGKLPNLIQDVSDKKLLTTLNEMDIHPGAWVSRHVRTSAISGAAKVVRMSVEYFIETSVAGGAEFKILRDEIENMAGLTWNGWLYPYDLLFAFAKCINRGAHVQAIVTTNKAGAYADKVSLEALKDRLIEVMVAQAVNDAISNVEGDVGQILISAAVDYKTPVEKKVKDQFKVVRIMGNAGQNNHSKVICVDDELLYIGSENAYPSYNEEHGVWIEDDNAIKAWLKDYWDPLWKVSDSKNPDATTSILSPG